MSVQVLIPWRNTGCSHRADALGWVLNRWKALHPRWGIVIGNSPDGPWNIAAALNDALHKATADVVLLMGADTALDHRIIDESVSYALEGRWVLPADTLIRFTPEATRIVLAMPPAADLPDHGHRQQSERGWGPVVGPRQALLDTPYDERFVGWGGEDEAAWMARTTFLGPPVRLPGYAYMLWHPTPPVHEHYAANLALLDRYQEASGDAGRMAAVCGFDYLGKPCGGRLGHSGAHMCA